ncbi:ribonuclease H-like domain-containing protein [Candidatus Woesearchaeota archaeon]|nr:ribonuclease H-like domain-containing protein [Candidatus Woesearchaeota archaeon]
MIRNSFIFLDQISTGREQAIWSQGIDDWDDFLRSKEVSSIAPWRKGHYDRQLQQAWQQLDQHNASYFARTIPAGETWRLYPAFKNNVCFLDIETTGYYGDITVIGLYDGEETKTLVRGFNLDKETLQKALENVELLVTFNGSSFDLPVIQRYFGSSLPVVPHIDLRHVCAKVGLRGGLKKIEGTVGITRPEEVQGVTGYDAVLLWQRWNATGKREHLDKLVQYNTEDIINLEPIANKVIGELWKQVRFGEDKKGQAMEGREGDSQDREQKDGPIIPSSPSI